jgi:hypothetical protein
LTRVRQTARENPLRRATSRRRSTCAARSTRPSSTARTSRARQGRRCTQAVRQRPSPRSRHSPRSGAVACVRRRQPSWRQPASIPRRGPPAGRAFGRRCRTPPAGTGPSAAPAPSRSAHAMRGSGDGTRVAPRGPPSEVRPRTDDSLVHAAEVSAWRSQQGPRIREADSRIATTALTPHLVWVAENVHQFRRLPGVSLERWRGGGGGRQGCLRGFQAHSRRQRPQPRRGHRHMRHMFADDRSGPPTCRSMPTGKYGA